MRYAEKSMESSTPQPCSNLNFNFQPNVTAKENIRDHFVTLITPVNEYTRELCGLSSQTRGCGNGSSQFFHS
jgi:hypothetical protein